MVEQDEELCVDFSGRQGGYAALVTSSQLCASMFTRLFFMEGHGLQYFTPVTSQNQIAGGAIHVYKTDWKKHEPLHISALKMNNSTKEEVAESE